MFTRRFGFLGVFTTLAVSTPAGAQAPGKVLASGNGPIQVEAPLSLTASDGAGLELVSLSAQVVVEDPLAFTELHLVFRNPEPRVREGRFRITLPSGAAISRFAMKVANHWQEGEVVELQAAREAYEDFLHRRQDPALLETEAGNEFSARVFPIPAGATKELVVSYSQELVRSHEGYRLPLRGLPRLGTLAIHALVARADAGNAASSLGGTRSRHEVVDVNRRDFTPDRDFEVPLGSTGRLGLRHENLVVARVRPLEATLPPDPVRGLTVLFDTSASRALGFGDQLARLSALVATLAKGGDFPLTVAAFDQSVEPMYSGPASGFAGAEKRLRDRRALGASDLGAALAWVATQKQGAARLLLVSDGVATAGETANDKLRARVRSLGSHGVERLDVLAVGGIRDDERLGRLVAAGLPRAGVVLEASATPAECARRLALATRSGLIVEVAGSAWVWPQRLDGVQPGDEVLVYADLPPAQALHITVGGKAITGAGTLARIERPLLERAWVKARIARLTAQRDALVGSDRDLADAMQKQIVDLSIKHRVLTPYTALLVLETEADYARFHIERRALADILTVGPGGMAVLERRDVVLAPELAGQIEGTGPAPQLGLARKAKGHTGAQAHVEKFDKLDDLLSSALASKPSARREENMRIANAPASEPAQSNLQAMGSGGLGGSATSGAVARSRVASPAPTVAAAAPRLTPPLAEAPPPAPARQRAASEGLMGVVGRGTGPGAQRLERAMPDRDGFADGQGGGAAPYEGRLAEVMALLAHGQRKEALARALAWRQQDPGDVLALVAIGEAAEASGDLALAARAYGSIIDLFPGRADLRRFAGNRLEHLHGAASLALAIDTYRKAVEQRPDHPASHRLLAFALARAKRPAEAFEALAAGAQRSYPAGRFAGIERIFAEDLGLLAAAWTRAEPARAGEIEARLERLGGRAEDRPSLRFVLTWETDANDVDFHIQDARGGHAFYAQPRLPSGGELYADVTTGYGPECFTIRNPVAARAYPYHLEAHYYRRGPMGYGMGKLQIIEHDGHGNLHFDERPFVVMSDGAFVDMGTVSGPRLDVEKAGVVLAPR